LNIGLLHMLIHLPYTIEYEVKQNVPLSDVIATLEANRDLFAELPSLIESIVPGLSIERLDLSVGEISHGSLREMFFAALYIAFQEELKKEVPAMIESWLGIPVDDKYDTLLTVSVLLLVYIGVDYVMKRIRRPDDEVVKAQIDAIVAELSSSLSISEDQIRHAIGSQLYQKPNRIKKIAKAAIKLFRPSKKQQNEPVVISGRRIETEFIRKVPHEYEYNDDDDIIERHEGVSIDIHAKDIDKKETGWAGTVRSVYDKRLRLKLVAPVKSEHIWEKDSIKADILLVKKIDREGIPRPVFAIVTTVYKEKPQSKTKKNSRKRKTTPPTGDHPLPQLLLDIAKESGRNPRD
jgi:hypothetical protein